MGAFAISPGVKILTERNVPNYETPERAAAAFRAMSDYRVSRAELLPVFEHIDVVIKFTGSQSKFLANLIDG